MEITIAFRSITGAVCDIGVSRDASFAQACTLAVASPSNAAGAFAFVKNDLSNVALYYNVRC